MHLSTYDEKSDSVGAVSFDAWEVQTSKDDERKAKLHLPVCKGKRVLEFGCGNGGFLKRIINEAESVVGVELDDEAVKKLNKDGIRTVRSIDELNGKFDVICMFDVIEHLSEPYGILKQLYELLECGGILICETPNSDDALLTYYNCKAFADFTYWSKHVYLYNSETLARLFMNNGFNVLKNTQIQRYQLSNHLYWLKEGLPGGHTKWTEFNDEKLNEEYSKLLHSMKICDTLLIYLKKYD